MGAGLWAKPLPDLVAAGHQGQLLSGALHLGPSAPRTGAGLRISLAKPGGRKGSSRDWVKDSQIVPHSQYLSISLVLISCQSVFSTKGPVAQHLNTLYICRCYKYVCFVLVK